MMGRILTAALPLLAAAAALTTGLPASHRAMSAAANGPVARAVLEPLPRLVLYYQTTHDSLGRPISMLPLITEKQIALTHLIVCSFHINPGKVLTLNDYPPDYPLFYTLWNETEVMKSAGVKVMGMIGGAAAGSFEVQTLDGDTAAFEHYYAQLRDAIITYGLEGMDLDVEQPMSLAGIYRLVNRLREDFGPDFITSLAPVATALRGGANLSGFDYRALDSVAGGEIAFYNAQFYNGFGNMGSTSHYDSVINEGWSPRKVLVGQITTPVNGGGYVSNDRLNATIVELRRKYGQIGGIMGWEYFNSAPGGLAQPWQWAQVMTQILRPAAVPRLRVSKSQARVLTTAWRESVGLTGDGFAAGEGGSGTVAGFVLPERFRMNVDYTAMVNA